MKIIKTKRGYFTIDNGYVTWFFYEVAASSACTEYANGNVPMLDELCIFKINSSNYECIYSKWPHHVRGIPALVAQLKKDRLKKERDNE